jgi:hypothetical protein
MQFVKCNIAGKACSWILSLCTSLENLVVGCISLAFCMSRSGLLFLCFLTPFYSLSPTGLMFSWFRVSLRMASGNQKRSIPSAQK